MSKDLAVPPPQINRTPFLVLMSPVELTCVDGLLHVNSAVRVYHLLVVGQTGIHLKVGEADPQERRHGCGFIIPDLCRYPGDAATTQPRGFFLQMALASMSAAFPPPRCTPTGPSFPSEGRQDGRGGGGGSLLHALAALNDLTEEETKLERHHHHSVTTRAGFLADSCLVAAPLTVLH